MTTATNPSDTPNPKGDSLTMHAVVHETFGAPETALTYRIVDPGAAEIRAGGDEVAVPAVAIPAQRKTVNRAATKMIRVSFILSSFVSG